MNNEEKILELLARHEDSFERLHQTLTEIKADMVGMQATLEEVDQRSIRTQVLLETDCADKIDIAPPGGYTKGDQ